MRVFILILCFFVAFLTSANAEELYRCVDQSGNAIVTEPPAGWGWKTAFLNHADEEDSAAENQETEESESADRQENNQGASDDQTVAP